MRAFVLVQILHLARNGSGEALHEPSGFERCCGWSPTQTRSVEVRSRKRLSMNRRGHNAKTASSPRPSPPLEGREKTAPVHGHNACAKRNEALREKCVGRCHTAPHPNSLRIGRGKPRRGSRSQCAYSKRGGCQKVPRQILARRKRNLRRDSASSRRRLRQFRYEFMLPKADCFGDSSLERGFPWVVWIWNSVFQFCPSGGQFSQKTGVYPCSYGRFWVLAPRLLVGLGMKNDILRT
jgi:hypothetical protein